MGEVVMRDYQRAGFEAVREQWKCGNKRTVVCYPTGTGKCQSLCSFCWSEGLTTIGELFAKQATRIMGPGGPKEIAGWHDDGVREGLKATLECGLTIDGTREHRIWCRRDDGFEGWVKLGELQGNEYAAVARGQADWGKLKVDSEDAYLLGLLYQSNFSENRTVPLCILRGTKQAVRSFLRGYWDGDGWVDGQIRCSSASSVLIDQIHQLLLGLGVYCARSLKPVPGHCDAHILAVRDVQAFDREVGITRFGITKDQNYDRLLAKKRNTNLDTVPGIGRTIQAMGSGLPSKCRRKDSWRQADAYYDGKKKPSYPLVRELAEAAPPSPARGRRLRRRTPAGAGPRGR